MNYSLTALLYTSAVVATSLAAFGVGGLFLAATTLAIWRLAFPGDKPLPALVEKILASYVIMSLGIVLMICGLWGLEGWSFDPEEYDLAPNISRWMFLAVSIAPLWRWMQVKRGRPAKVEEEIELPENFS